MHTLKSLEGLSEANVRRITEWVEKHTDLSWKFSDEQCIGIYVYDRKSDDELWENVGYFDPRYQLGLNHELYDFLKAGKLDAVVVETRGLSFARKLNLL